MVPAGDATLMQDIRESRPWRLSFVGQPTANHHFYQHCRTPENVPGSYEGASEVVTGQPSSKQVDEYKLKISCYYTPWRANVNEP